VEGEHHFFLRELGTAFGPYMYCKLNEALMEPAMARNGWVTPPVMIERRPMFAYWYRGKVTFIATSLCEEYPTMVDDGRDVAFVVPTYGQGVSVYWKGQELGPYRDVMQWAIHSGELLVAAHDQEGKSVLYRDGRRELTFPEYGIFQISRDGTSNLFRVNREDSTEIYVNGVKAGEGLLYTCGETVVDGVPHWYWMSKEGNQVYLTLYRFP
jgi:hypothetical protein